MTPMEWEDNQRLRISKEQRFNLIASLAREIFLKYPMEISIDVAFFRAKTFYDKQDLIAKEYLQ